MIPPALQRIVDANATVLEIWLTADSEHGHVAQLLDWLAPPLNADVVDMGCGIGGVARLMGAMRPDLTFLLLNNKEFEFALCDDLVRPQFLQHVADMVDTGLPDESVDVVMANYSIGYVDIEELFAETRRILRPGGVLFIYDLVGRAPELKELAGYTVRSHDELLAASRAFDITLMVSPPANCSQFKRVTKEDSRALMIPVEQAIERTRPIALRLVKPHDH